MLGDRVKVIDCEQGSPEWAGHRAGKVTASRLSDVLSRSRDRKSEGSTRRNYKAQIISEILTGKPQENGFTSKAMDDGIELEPFARSAYEVAKDVLIDKVGLVLHPTIERYAASPDGLVGPHGLMQIKCPYAATHIGYLLAKEVPTDYQPQMLAEMDCAERDWCDFVSYCPALPTHLQLFVVRFPRDEKRILEMRAEVSVFNREVDEMIERLGRIAA